MNARRRAIARCVQCRLDVRSLGLIISLASCAAPQRLSPPPLDTVALDSFAARAMRDLEVPGAAIAVVRDGDVIYERVFGTKQLGADRPITRDTRFLLASATKPLTTLMIQALVDDKALAWDTPVSELLPSFALGDGTLTRQLRLWHMVCACTGMPRRDMESLFEWEGVTPEARLDLLRSMHPTSALGAEYHYSNLMIAAGGFIAAHRFAPEAALADAYASAMQAKVFEPLGMRTATLRFATVLAGDHALPHARDIQGTLRPMPLAIERAVEPIAPAGGAWVSLRDMERLALHEALGVGERGRARIAIDDHSSYGLGYRIKRKDGITAFTHDGGAFGFGTTLYVVPSARTAIVILTNVRNDNAQEHLPFVAVMRQRLLEALSLAPRAAEALLAEYRRIAPGKKPHVMSDRGWLPALVGRYHHPLLGDVHITTDGMFDVGEWKSRFDRVVNADGRTQLVLLDPPFAGPSVLVENGTLIVPGDPPYILERR
ncbi:MAG: serine hydrolase domain-containing protein [Kofleriaceae bacterium]|nr:serine hydrolase domain-containing protein [Kofleriaceae bacterium]